MIPTITDLNKGMDPNDAGEEWLKASEDARSLSIVFKKLANDQSNAYEKTIDRIISSHGQGAKYRSPSTGRFIKASNAMSNDNRYEEALNRIVSSDDSDKERTIHEYNPNIPQSVYKDMPKLLMRNDRPIQKNEGISAGDNRSEIDLLKSIDNSTTNILETLHRISFTLDDFNDVDSLKAREKDLETGKGISQEKLEAILAGLSGAKKDGKEVQEKGKGGFLENLVGLGKDAGWAIGLGAAGLASTAVSKIIGTDSPVESGGGYTGEKQQNRADSPHRRGQAPIHQTVKSPILGGKPTTTGTSFKNGTLHLSEKDVTDLEKVVQTEWDPKAGPEQAEAIVDTILNRLASGKWGHTVKEVVDKKNQFSAINGPHSDGRTSVDQYNIAIKKSVKDIVDKHLANRSKGSQSLVGDNLNYANPRYISPNNREWVSGLNGPVFGQDNHMHVHGTVPSLNKYRPGPFRVESPGHIIDDVNVTSSTESLTNIKNESDRKVVKALRNVKAGQQVRFKDGAEAAIGTINIHMPPAHKASSETERRVAHMPPPEKRRPQPARSGFWSEWKDYFGL